MSSTHATGSGSHTAHSGHDDSKTIDHFMHTEAPKGENLKSTREIDLDHARTTALQILRDEHGVIDISALAEDQAKRDVVKQEFQKDLSKTMFKYFGVAESHQTDPHRLNELAQAYVGSSFVSFNRYFDLTKGDGFIDQRNFSQATNQGISNALRPGDHSDRGMNGVHKGIDATTISLLHLHNLGSVVDYVDQKHYPGIKAKIDPARIAEPEQAYTFLQQFKNVNDQTMGWLRKQPYFKAPATEAAHGSH